MRPIATVVTRSVVCVSVCFLVTDVLSKTERMNRSRCRLGADSCSSKEPCRLLDEGQDQTNPLQPQGVTSRRCDLLPNGPKTLELGTEGDGVTSRRVAGFRTKARENFLRKATTVAHFWCTRLVHSDTLHNYICTSVEL